MNYYINGKRVLLNAGEAIIVNSRQMHYGYSENGQECDFICILCHPKILTANSVLYQSYITPVLSNPALEYLHLKPENPEDTEALQTLPEILRLKKEQPTAYEIEAHAPDDAGRQHRRLTGSRSSDPARYGFLYLQPLQ